jgi:hypothetical protein
MLKIYLHIREPRHAGVRQQVLAGVLDLVANDAQREDRKRFLNLYPQFLPTCQGNAGEA